MFCAFVRKRLETSLDEANYVVIVTVAGKGVINVKSLQKPYVKLGVMPDFGPFSRLHSVFQSTFLKQGWMAGSIVNLFP